MRNIWWLPGAAMIFFGVLIFVFPELLAYIVATAFIGFGVAMIMGGRLLRGTMRSGGIQTYRVYTSQQTQDTIYHE